MPSKQAPLKVFLLDNFDSFSFNLAEEFSKRHCAVEVWRNTLKASVVLEILRKSQGPHLVVLSPGPGIPESAGCGIELVQEARGEIPIFGVCLGHQIIVRAYGGEVTPAAEIVHGRASAVTHDGQGIFSGLPSPLQAGRYHSLVATGVPHGLCVQAHCNNLVMAVRHETHPVVGVQFHPESMLTTEGGSLIGNVIDWACRARRAVGEGERVHDC